VPGAGEGVGMEEVGWTDARAQHENRPRPEDALQSGGEGWEPEIQAEHPKGRWKWATKPAQVPPLP